ncbi:MAG: hypothetical protein VR73_12955 [Gammaproteobacteria bacterium BRH_c0]|nr:MAG: hypothetical protein VR73_12955 [Gammaproteobacteria bacterium BRH_c0]
MPDSHKNKFSRRINDLTSFKVVDFLDAAMARQAAGENIIRMEVGEPVFELPSRVAKAAQQAIASGANGYTSSLGIAPLREAIAAFCHSRYGVSVDPQRVVVTTGSSAALGMICDLLLNPGDSLLLSDPGYPCNANFVYRCGATPVQIPVTPEKNYQPDLADLQHYWQESSAGLLVASPSNPTGDIIDRATLAALYEGVKARGGAFIVDEIYHGLCYGDEQPCSALNLGDDLYVINSFSKYFGMPGWRLGWMVVPEQALDAIRIMTQNFFISPPTVAQHAAVAAFHPESLEVFDLRREALQARRDFLVPALRDLGFGIHHPPAGAFYIYADIIRFSDDGEAFCWDLLERAGIAITPGTDFGHFNARNHVRFSYTAEPIERLREAVERLARVLL